MAGSPGPGGGLAGRGHAVGEGAQFRRRHRDDVAHLVGEALARRIAVLDGREEGAEKEYGAVRVLMMFVEHLAGQVGGIAADLRHVGGAVQHIAILALDPERQLHGADVIEAEA